MAKLSTTEQTDAATLWETARRRLCESNQDTSTEEPLDFSGERFPSDPAHKYFHGLHFLHEVSFADAKFACLCPFNGCEFRGEADWTDSILDGDNNRFVFEQCKFTSPVDFRHCQLPQVTEFRGVVFEDEVDFRGKEIQTLRFEPVYDADKVAPCRFGGAVAFDAGVFEQVSFIGAQFERDASFKQARFTYWSRFRETVFKGKADFSHCRFERVSAERRQGMPPAERERNQVDFVKTVFEYDVSFLDAEFQCDTEFTDAQFARDVVFDGAEIHRTLRFRCKCDGGGVISLARVRFHAEREGESIYRAAKNSAHARGDSRAEGEYHFREQCASNAGDRQDGRWCSWPWFPNSKLRAWGSYVFGRGVYGYGEKPESVIVVGLAVIAVWAMLYDILDAAGSAASSFGTYLYFSIVTFTTLGYGDLQPNPGMARVLAGSEALLGAALMALFVVALTRKYTR